MSGECPHGLPTYLVKDYGCDECLNELTSPQVICPRCLTERDGSIILCSSCGACVVPVPIVREDE